MTEQFIKNVKFAGNPKVRDEMVGLVDELLKAGTEIESDLDLSSGLSALSATCKIKIIDEDDSLSIRIETGDDDKKPLRFVIHKKTKTVYQAGDELDEEVSIDEDMDFLDEI